MMASRCDETKIAVSLDDLADAAYIYLAPSDQPRHVAQSRLCQMELEQAAITIDFDESGRILGIEILGAKELLPEDLMNS